MKRTIALFFCSLFAITCFSQKNNIVPAPQKVVYSQGSFVFSNCSAIRVDEKNEDLLKAVRPLVSKLRIAAGIDLLSAKKCKTGNVVRIALDNTIKSPEGYQIVVKPSVIDIKAQQPSGVFYAVQTLLQLLPVNIESPVPVKNEQWKISCVEVEDAPRFAYRGVMLDVARHYMALDSVKRIIDLIAMQKMNRFHWHLTDSQGWRFESKKFPKLTKIGAFRKGTPLNTTYDYNSRPNDTLYGGFYTEDQMREIVKYAADRFITVVPEIEMPAHSKSALAAYPELACLDSNGHAFAYPSDIQDEYCTKDETFTFLDGILEEVMDIFPSEYIHIAGDEAGKANWKKCKFDQQRMKDENLKDVEELQSYFIKRIAQFVNSKGRKVIGWDEIMQGGLAPGAAVMSWTGVENGIKAAKQEHNVVMTPGGYCYLDHYQSDAPGEPVAFGGLTTLSKAYSYEPVPAELNAAQGAFINGVQGNLWTEHIPYAKKAEYMIFPRAIALAEVGWSQPQQKNYEDFARRLSSSYLKRLDLHGVNYSKHMYDLKLVNSVDGKGNVFMQLGGVANGKNIYYTLDGTTPSEKSPVYKQRVLVKHDCVITAALLNDGIVTDRLQKAFAIHKGVGKRATLKNAPNKNYNRGGNDAWHNGSKGSDEQFSNDEWLGWNDEVFEGTLDFGKAVKFNSVKTRFFHKPSSWIWMPKSIIIEVSDDGTNFRTIAKKELQVPANEGAIPVELTFDQVNARYFRVTAEPHGKIAPGNVGAGDASWLFVDEVVIE
ncbi:family 20 glycosylhydrolase [Danxiaibacter flavus]|uniref:beta-N-acetylhexosaminidase n=1 Tax=Danxiaibacter flavus TaxID=3049108 RepID=A0ABV3ZGS4_9BACT|nr:family 20 glycosylhydrolase [Chitinophagaceae bacterium DXS]